MDRRRKHYEALPRCAGISMVAADGELLVVSARRGRARRRSCATAGSSLISAGTISIAGRDVTRKPPARRNVAMVFQTYALFPHLTAAGNIGFGFRHARSRGR